MTASSRRPGPGRRLLDRLKRFRDRWLWPPAAFFLDAPARSLGLLSAFIAVVAARGEWLAFPLSAPVPGTALALIDGTGVTFGRLIQVLVVAAAMVALVAPRLAIAVVALALSVALWLVVDVALLSPPLLEAYVTETWQRRLMQGFAAQQFLRNESPDPAFTAIDSFTWLTDQLALAWAMLGWGWTFTVAAILGLAVAILARCPGGPAVSLFWCVTLVPPVVVAASPLARLVDGERLQLEGDRLAGSAETAGDGVAAYAAALQANPALAAATPFLAKASDAIRLATGGRHPLGEIGAASRVVAGSGQTRADPLALSGARLRLDDLDSLDPASAGPAGPLGDALIAFAGDLRIRLLLAEGLAFYADENRLAAAAAFERALRSPAGASAALLLARVHLDGRTADAALEPLTRLEAQIAHPDVRADVICSIGDVLTRTSRLVDARAAYRRCREADGDGNYRVVRALSGS